MGEFFFVFFDKGIKAARGVIGKRSCVWMRVDALGREAGKKEGKEQKCWNFHWEETIQYTIKLELCFG